MGNPFEILLDEDSKESEFIKKNEQKIYGITTGVVKSNWDNDEQKHPGMVKVEFFLGEEGRTMTDWVRVAQAYAGNGYGQYWLPEVGDEVILAFNLGDLNKPYIIGSLWNNKDKIPEKTADDKNSVKRIKTKGGHEIIFEEEKGKERLEIHTPGNLKITLEDEKKIIAVQDENGKNMVQIDGKNGKITVTAEKAISFKAGDTILELDSQGKKATLKAGTISLEAQQELRMKAEVSLKGEGNMLELKSNGPLKVESGSMLALKGSITKIN